MKPFKIKIPFLCRSKKNSQELAWNPKTKKPMIIQSKLYRRFEKDCGLILNRYRGMHIMTPINLKCTFYVPDRRKRDITNLTNAIQDILVKYDILQDDNYNIVAGLDGTRIIFEKGREETIIEIEEIK